MRRLHLGAGLNLPLDAVTETIAILAKRGSGKTYTASVLAEELLKAGQPLGVLDPTGAWYGLRSSADGKGEGFPITILGGDHADVPLDEAAGKDIAEIMVQERVPLVLDLSRLSKAAMRRFVADFAEHLYQKNREPLHLIIDEADAFAPQKPRPDEMRMLGALDDIVRRGRIRGLGVTLVTQRSAVLNKDVLTQAEVLIALRTPHPKDRAPVLEWMKVHATPEQMHQVEESLAGLEIGEAWVMSAGWLDLFRKVRIRKRETFNSSATPKPGEKRVEPRKLAQVDLDALQKKFSAAIEQAKATDPRALQKKIAELQAQVKRLETAKGPKEKVVTKEVYVLKEGQLKRIEAAAERARQAGSDYLQAAKTLAQAVAPAVQPAPSRAATENRPSPQPGASEMHKMHTPSRSPPMPVNRPAVAPGALAGDREFDGHLKPAERRILEQAAAAPNGLTKHQLGIRARYRPDTGHFGNMLSALQGYGVLVKEHERYFATDYGKSLVPLAQPLIGIDLREKWRHHLAPTEWKLLSAIIDSYPNGITKEDLAAATGYRADTGHFGNLISTLTGGALVEKRDGRYGAMEEFFAA